MVDRVYPLKLETTGDGSQTDLYPNELNPNEDAVSARGLYIQNDTSDDLVAFLSRDASNRMTVQDTEIATPTTIRQLRTAQLLYTGAETAGKTLQTDGASGIQLAEVVSGYPPAFDTELSDTTETTTLSTWQEKLSLTTPSLELGSYILLVQAVMSGSKSNSQFEVRAQYDDTDTFGNLNAQAGVAFSEYQFFTHTIKESISGVHTVDIDYRQVAGSGYVSIRGARVTYWRVSSG
jgi:hypothetical protein